MNRVALHCELDVDEALHFQGYRQLPGRSEDFLHRLVGDRRWRSHASGVSRVDSGFLDMFHHPADEQLVPVENGIDVDLDG